MHLYQVGGLYHPSRTRWPQTCQFNFRDGEAELVIFLSGPKPEEVSGIRSGKAEFALLVERGLILLLFQFHRAGLAPMGATKTAMPWSEAVFNWWRLPEGERRVPGDEPTEESRQLLSVLLVDASTGILLVIRAVTLSPEFTEALRSAIRAQALAEKFLGEEEVLASLYQRYPQTSGMVRDASARCTGGA